MELHPSIEEVKNIVEAFVTLKGDGQKMLYAAVSNHVAGSMVRMFSEAVNTIIAAEIVPPERRKQAIDFATGQVHAEDFSMFLAELMSEMAGSGEFFDLLMFFHDNLDSLHKNAKALNLWIRESETKLTETPKHEFKTVDTSLEKQLEQKTVGDLYQLSDQAREYMNIRKDVEIDVEKMTLAEAVRFTVFFVEGHADYYFKNKNETPKL